MHAAARLTLAAIVLLSAATAASAQGGMLDTLKKELGGAGAAAGAAGGSGGNNNNSDAGSSAAAGGMGTAGVALAKGMGLSLPEIGSGTMGNAAGVLQYCIRNNYLSADAAGGIKEKLLGMVTGQKPQQTGFASGAKGLLQGSDGTSLNLRNVGARLRTKACDYVLDSAKSLI